MALLGQTPTSGSHSLRGENVLEVGAGDGVIGHVNISDGANPLEPALPRSDQNPGGVLLAVNGEADVGLREPRARPADVVPVGDWRLAVDLIHLLRVRNEPDMSFVSKGEHPDLRQHIRDHEVLTLPVCTHVDVVEGVDDKPPGSVTQHDGGGAVENPLDVRRPPIRLYHEDEMFVDELHRPVQFVRTHTRGGAVAERELKIFLRQLRDVHMGRVLDGPDCEPPIVLHGEAHHDLIYKFRLAVGRHARNYGYLSWTDGEQGIKTRHPGREPRFQTVGVEVSDFIGIMESRLNTHNGPWLGIFNEAHQGVLAVASEDIVRVLAALGPQNGITLGPSKAAREFLCQQLSWRVTIDRKDELLEHLQNVGRRGEVAKAAILAAGAVLDSCGWGAAWHRHGIGGTSLGHGDGI